ncbi:MAG: tripartite tricarboxylate transporter substrate binding protein [Hyphomicrobiales bacterium]|nr:tripartite tricarboxylate transporter substrate binding protein [Hyphomicrobiales bacterium]MBV8827581.1 tripartite tricarboxylate transporter substrate binding protein [Hyphomicrobiales bacterium]
MRIPRRKFLRLAASAATLPMAARMAQAQTYPSRPARLVVGFAPGGGNDIVARLIAQWLSERTGQQFFVENRPGAGTNIATEIVVSAAPDGYTLLLAGVPNAYNAALYHKLNFVFLRDIAPVAGVARGPLVMLLHPSVPVKTVPEFIAYAKANPGKINMASSGIGGGGHLAGELFKMLAGVNLVHVPFRGNGPALTALLGGQVDVLFPSLASSIGYIKSGQLRGLGVTAATRSDAVPDLPTVGEFVPGYDVDAWYGIGAPKGTRAEIVDKLYKEISAGLADLKLKARFADLGDAPMPMTPAEFGKLITDETEKWGNVVKFAGIKLE